MTTFHAVIFVLLAAAGTWAFFNSRRTARAIKGAASWPEVPGKVEAASVERQDSTDSDGDVTTTYCPKVSYSYEYQGASRTGARLFVGAPPTYSSEAAATKAIAAYPVGGAVKVRVDPTNPANAALNVGGGTNLSGALILWGIAIASLFVGGH